MMGGSANGRNPNTYGPQGSGGGDKPPMGGTNMGGPRMMMIPPVGGANFQGGPGPGLNGPGPAPGFMGGPQRPFKPPGFVPPVPVRFMRK